MSENTVEFVIRANVDQFSRAIKGGAQVFRGEMAGLAGTAQTQSDRIRASMQRIGVRPFGDIDKDIQRLRLDYNALARSGQLSERALTQAHMRMQEGIRRLRAEKNGWTEQISQARAGLLAMVVAGYGVVRMLQGAVSASSEFQTRMAEISTLLDVTPQRMAALSREVRDLAVAMGVNAAGAAQALYDIISAGAPEASALQVLERSVRAAVAGVTDTQSAARVGLAVVNAYGREIDELGNVYDVLFQTVRSGVTTLPELSASLGQVLPIAAASKVPFEEVAAAIASMTQAGIRTAEATTALRSAITALSTPVPEAAKRMEEFGIQWDGLYNTLRAIAAADLDPAQLREIIPDVSARTAVLALTRDVNALGDGIRNMFDAAGAADEAYEKMANTPEQRMREFRAALNELAMQIGDLVTAGTPVVEMLTGVLRAMSGLPQEIKLLALGIAGVVVAKALWVAGLARVYQALRLAAAGVNVFSVALRGIPWLIALSEGAKLTTMFFEHRRAMREMREEHERWASERRALIDDNARFADTQAIATAQLAQMTDREIQEYRKRLEAARDYHEARRDLIAREHADEDPLGVSAEAIAAAREARVRREALDELDQYWGERETRQREHVQRLKTIKEEETEIIRVELARQLEAYDEALKDLERARKRREELEKRAQNLRDEFADAPEQTATQNVVAIYDEMPQALRALSEGNWDEAAKGAEQLEERLRRARDEGRLSTPEMQRLADQVAQIWEGIGEGQEQEALANLKAVQETIDELVSKAEFLKQIQIDFDADAAEQSADALRTQLQRQLEQNPLVIPVRVGGDDRYGKQAGDLLKDLPQRASGGLLRGPGTSTSDSFLARVSDGEYVVRAAAVQKYGLPFIDAINRLRLPGYADGGLVDRLSIPAPAPMMAAGGGGNSVYLTLPGGETVTLSGTDRQVEHLQETIAREAAKRGRRG